MTKVSNEAREIIAKHRTNHKWGYSVDSDQFMNAVTELSAANEKKRQDNAEEIKQIEDHIQQLLEERKPYEVVEQPMRDAEREYRRDHKDAWRKVAEPLGIKKYLTNNGAISKAKVRALGETEGRRILDIYNTQYVNAVNAETKRVHQDYQLKIAYYKRAAEEYNRLTNQINRLITRQNKLNRV